MAPKEMHCSRCGKTLLYIDAEGRERVLGHYSLGEEMVCIDCRGKKNSKNRDPKEKNTSGR